MIPLNLMEVLIKTLDKLPARIRQNVIMLITKLRYIMFVIKSNARAQYNRTKKFGTKELYIDLTEDECTEFILKKNIFKRLLFDILR